MTAQAPLFAPFKGLRPAPGRAADVAAPPYDVVTFDEAAALAGGKPESFLHVSRAEIDLPAGTDVYDASVYAKAAENLNAMVAAGTLIRDDTPSYYVYRMTGPRGTQTGIAGAASIAAYDANRVRRHELTRPDKEDDRVRQIEAVGAQTGPVLVVHKDNAEVSAALDAAASGAPDGEASEKTADGTVTHQLWRVADPETVGSIQAAFDAMDAIYIADGHHRSAAASRVAASRGETEIGGFLTVSFPTSEMTILDYNRVVSDLNGRAPEDLLSEVARAFSVEPADGAVSPDTPATFGMYLAGTWYRLTPTASLPTDPVERLDVSLLQDRLLSPLLGIQDPRTDGRIAFVGGSRGVEDLARRVDAGEAAVAFALHPTRIEDLIAVADANAIMPPKSTWFDPKLLDGMVSLVLD